MSTTSQEEFAARLARVRDGGLHSKSTIYVGQDEQHVYRRTGPAKQSKSQEVAGNALYPASLVGVFLLGFVAVIFSRYAVFHLAEGHTEEPGSQIEMILSGVVGMLCAFVLSQMFRMTSKEHRALQGAGVFMMSCLFHNLIHWMPGPATLAFSPDYVAQIISTAPVNTFRLGENYIPILPADRAMAAAASEECALSAEVAAAVPEAPVVKVLQLGSGKKPAKGGSKTVSIPQEAPAETPAAAKPCAG